MEWDTGHFLTGGVAAAYVADGDSVAFDFGGSRVDKRLTDMYGARSPMTTARPATGSPTST